MTAAAWPTIGDNWGRWSEPGGALNLITPAKRVQAAQLVQDGLTIPCARALDASAPAYYPAAAGAAFEHEMITAWKSNAGGDVQAGSDQITVQNHGLNTTHMDALSHIGHRGRGFDGIDFTEMITMEDGARSAAITDALGVCTRGVLADIPHSLGVDHLPHGTAVTADQLRAALPDVEPGDAVLVRTGSHAAPPAAREDGDAYGALSGLHADCFELLADLDVALVGTDGPGDTFPIPIPDCNLPVHVLALVYLGIHLVHNMDLERLSAWADGAGRQTFMFVVSPLNIPGGTGSAVTPLAIV